jgi:hypothetical protein
LRFERGLRGRRTPTAALKERDRRAVHFVNRTRPALGVLTFGTYGVRNVHRPDRNGGVLTKRTAVGPSAALPSRS